MTKRKPLVLADGNLQQLQSQDDLDIPLEQRVEALELLIASLVLTLQSNDFEIIELDEAAFNEMTGG